MSDLAPCPRCRREPAGYAMIDRVRYCHTDERTCYRDALFHRTVNGRAQRLLDGM